MHPTCAANAPRTAEPQLWPACMKGCEEASSRRIALEAYLAGRASKLPPKCRWLPRPASALGECPSRARGCEQWLTMR